MYVLRKRKRIDAHLHHGAETDALNKCPGSKEIFWTGEYPEEEMKRVEYCHAKSVLKHLREVFNMAPWPADGNLTLEHLIENMDNGNVVCGVLCGLDTEYTTGWGKKRKTFRWHVPLEYTKECIDRYPGRFVGQLGVWPARGADHCIGEIKRAVEVLGDKFVGIKIYNPFITFSPDDEERCYPIYQFCEDNDISVTFHHWLEPIRGTRLKYCSAYGFDNILSDFPDLRVLILHGGLTLGEERLPYAMMVHSPNVYLCLTPIRPPLYARSPWELGRDIGYWKRLLELHPDHLMWGTDYPVTLADESAAYIELASEISDDLLNKFFYENAKRFFKIKGV